MTRKKKDRANSEASPVFFDRPLKKNDIASLAKKRAKKRKGLTAGSRHSVGKKHASLSSGHNKNDPRLGSKKPIALVIDPAIEMTKSGKISHEAAEKELKLLENDTQLMTLLDRIENGEKLGAGLQAMVDEKLDRIEALMDVLGLLEEE